MKKTKYNPHFNKSTTSLTKGFVDWSEGEIPVLYTNNLEENTEELSMTEKNKMETLVGLVEEWAIDKNIHNADSRGQFLKVVEEAAEISEGILTLETHGKEKEAWDMIEDAIGDTFVTLIILSQQQGLSFAEMLESAEGRTESLSDLDLKLMLHLGRISKALARKLKGEDVEGVEKAITDIISVLNALAVDFNMKPSDCLQVAYNVISKRKGKTVNGVFIKQEDLPDGE